MSRTMSQGAGDRSFFLRASRDIEYVKQHGRRLSTACFNLLVCRTTDAQTSRVGIVVGRRFGIAVRRNRVKRLFRELSRQVRSQLAADRAIVNFGTYVHHHSSEQFRVYRVGGANVPAC